MNMMRVPGTGVYENAAFHDSCDELGMLVWQDFMFANLDYPFADDAFRATVEARRRSRLERLGRPAEPGGPVRQQRGRAAGRDARVGPRARAAGRSSASAARPPCAPRWPTRSTCRRPPLRPRLPFRADRGVANYFGVGGYRRPLADVRASRRALRVGVPGVRQRARPTTSGPDRRDRACRATSGADWDFADVRDHYLGLLDGVDPVALLAADAQTLLRAARVRVTGEVMAEVFGEWRRAGSPCGGGLVLWLRDLVPGAGWGIARPRGRAEGRPGTHLRRALAPRRASGSPTRA